ncbi:hypothetical protein [Sphingomicrobium clamense]|uniref:HEPN domain-containing protein n=1 Tax=Sphingomicrobium clamense TaxID=2851013 RepID=A0ABS6V529_9SPHN|nr:hypothetical protein [Sphingomicrobium sp. B8]MBW0144307.1 hypothetical protein [Sphingomicrobium sp. B8]
MDLDLVDPLDPDAYYTSARAYLRRAREALRKKDVRNLFYAAFELRCCVEARQLEYADALVKLQGKKIRAWKISETYNAIQANSGNGKIVQMQFRQSANTFDLFHVPVSVNLKSSAEKLGDFLHAREAMFRVGSTEHERLLAHVIETYRLSWLCCKGDALVPPLFANDSHEIHPLRIELDQEIREKLSDFCLDEGSEVEFQVKYLDEPPADWIAEF